MRPVRILLIDDHAIFRMGLRMALSIGMADAEIFEAPSTDVALREPPA